MDYFHKELSDGKQKLSWKVLCEYSHLKKKKECRLEVGISLLFKNPGKLFPFGGWSFELICLHSKYYGSCDSMQAFFFFLTSFRLVCGQTLNMSQSKSQGFSYCNWNDYLLHFDWQAFVMCNLLTNVNCEYNLYVYFR